MSDTGDYPAANGAGLVGVIGAAFGGYQQGLQQKYQRQMAMTQFQREQNLAQSLVQYRQFREQAAQATNDRQAATMQQQADTAATNLRMTAVDHINAAQLAGASPQVLDKMTDSLAGAMTSGDAAKFRSAVSSQGSGQVSGQVSGQGSGQPASTGPPAPAGPPSITPQIPTAALSDASQGLPSGGPSPSAPFSVAPNIALASATPAGPSVGPPVGPAVTGPAQNTPALTAMSPPPQITPSAGGAAAPGTPGLNPYVSRYGFTPFIPTPKVAPPPTVEQAASAYKTLSDARQSDIDNTMNLPLAQKVRAIQQINANPAYAKLPPVEIPGQYQPGVTVPVLGPPSPGQTSMPGAPIANAIDRVGSMPSMPGGALGSIGSVNAATVGNSQLPPVNPDGTPAAASQGQYSMAARKDQSQMNKVSTARTQQQIEQDQKVAAANTDIREINARLLRGEDPQSQATDLAALHNYKATLGLGPGNAGRVAGTLPTMTPEASASLALRKAADARAAAAEARKDSASTTMKDSDWNSISAASGQQAGIEAKLDKLQTSADTPQNRAQIKDLSQQAAAVSGRLDGLRSRFPDAFASIDQTVGSTLRTPQGGFMKVTNGNTSNLPSSVQSSLNAIRGGNNFTIALPQEGPVDANGNTNLLLNQGSVLGKPLLPQTDAAGTQPSVSPDVISAFSHHGATVQWSPGEGAYRVQFPNGRTVGGAPVVPPVGVPPAGHTVRGPSGRSYFIGAIGGGQ